MSIERDKERLRAVMRRWRRDLSPETRSKAGRLLADRFFEAADKMTVAPLAGRTLAAYWPMGSELDTRDLLVRLEQAQTLCALPVAPGQGQPLVFRKWSTTTELESGPFGTWHPTDEAAEMDPDVLLVPMLAFDRWGYRLGQGGGYYDRTLRRLRPRRAIVAIGLAYSGQEVSNVPRDDADERLDWVVTEEAVVRLEKS